MDELEATLKELGEVSAAAAAASKLHEQLVEKLQLQKSKVSLPETEPVTESGLSRIFMAYS